MDRTAVVEIGRLEGVLAGPFAERASVLASAGIDEESLARRRAMLRGALAQSEAVDLREAFQAAFESGRAARRPSPVTSAPDGPSQGLSTPALAEAAQLDDAEPLPKPSYLLVEPITPREPMRPALSPRPAVDIDETSFPIAISHEPTLPFVPGDARAFVQAARQDEEQPSKERPTGDETQALDVSSILGAEALPFALEVETSLPRFVELLVALVEGPGQEDLVGARFGVASAVMRERVLAGWRARWAQDPALRAAWQRLYDERRAGRR